MKFEWDEHKNKANIGKHGISFEQATEIFDGQCITFEDTRSDYGEKREISIGVMEQVAILVVVHTDRAGVTRIISARPAQKKERIFYYDQIQKTFNS